LKWRNFDFPSVADIEGFVGWFQTRKAPVIRDSMLRAVREECGLGSPPHPFTTNSSETANFILKNKVDYQQSELPEFLLKLKELVHEQEREVERAIIGHGKYELRPQYQVWHVPETKWFTMMSAQREKHLQRFASTSITDVSFPDDAGSSTNTSLCIGRDQTLALSLSVHPNAFADGVRVPRNCLEGIWSKAAELLRTEGAIVSAPGVTDGAKFVLRYRGTNSLLVVPKKGGAFACDAECANCKAMGICAHSVAVAELSSKLPEFVAWFKRTKKCPNLSKFAEATMPKGRGKKGSENPWKRKAPSETENRIVNPFTVSKQVSSQPSVSATTAFSASASSVTPLFL